LDQKFTRISYFKIIMSRYSDEILTGLETIPLPDLASSLIVTGRAQPIISYKNGDTILAGFKQGNSN
jgi:hypothetical protein